MDWRNPASSASAENIRRYMLLMLRTVAFGCVTDQLLRRVQYKVACIYQVRNADNVSALQPHSVGYAHTDRRLRESARVGACAQPHRGAGGRRPGAGPGERDRLVQGRREDLGTVPDRCCCGRPGRRQAALIVQLPSSSGYPDRERRHLHEQAEVGLDLERPDSRLGGTRYLGPARRAQGGPQVAVSEATAQPPAGLDNAVCRAVRVDGLDDLRVPSRLLKPRSVDADAVGDRVDLVYALLHGARGRLPGQLPCLLAVADVGDREPEPVSKAVFPVWRLKQPHGAARILQRTPDQRERCVHTDDLGIAEQRAQGSEVVEGVAQRRPYGMAEVVWVSLVVVAAERTARRPPQATDVGVRAPRPRIRFAQDPEYLRHVFAVHVLHDASP